MARLVALLDHLGIHDELVAFFVALLLLLGPLVLLVLIVIRRTTGVAWVGGTTG